MARLNGKDIVNHELTTNRAFGEAYKQSNELALISLCSNSLLKRNTYRTESEEVMQLADLLQKVDPLFAAKCAIYVRRTLGMRTISHVMAVLLAPYIKGQPYARRFFNGIIYRLDDITEILAFQKSLHGKNSFPHAMTDGFAKAMERFDEYSFAKYQMKDREISIIDAIRICRPSLNDKNRNPITKLMTGKLTSNGNTWESKLSQVGRNSSKSEEQKEEMKIEAWIELLKEGKIGYFACLRNIRNIIKGGDKNLLNVEAANLAYDIIRNRDLANKAKILPFYFLTAISEIEKMQRSRLSDLMQNAINDVIESTCENMQKYDGDTVVCIDQSGSMQTAHVIHTAGYFGAILHKAWNSDIIVFGNDAKYINPNPRTPVVELAKQLGVANMGGTNFHSIFNRLKKPYERIIVLSDMQGWMGNSTPNLSVSNYRKKFDCNPQIYSWDLVGYGDMQFPESQTYCMAGLSEKNLDMFVRLSADKHAMIKIINEVEL